MQVLGVNLNLSNEDYENTYWEGTIKDVYVELVKRKNPEHPSLKYSLSVYLANRSVCHCTASEIEDLEVLSLGYLKTIVDSINKHILERNK